MNTQGIGQCKGSYNGLKGARFERRFSWDTMPIGDDKGFPRQVLRGDRG